MGMNKQLLKESIQRKEKSLLFFNASWCAACAEIRPVIEQIKRLKPDYKFYNMDSDDTDSKDLEDLFEVDYLPTLIVISETGYKEYSGARQIKKLLK
jgi:thiol-disulfide isomerase/thioredoxin